MKICETCHGSGWFGCSDYCHTIDCPDCHGTGGYETKAEEIARLRAELAKRESA